MLKLKLWQIETVVLMKVLEQDESTRCNILYNNDDLEIVSAYTPQLDQKCIYVRGCAKENDDNVSVFHCNSVQQAEAYISKIQRAVYEYNMLQHGYNMQQRREKSSNSDVNVYIAQ